MEIGIIINCENIGEVKGNGIIGGIVGTLAGSALTEVYNIEVSNCINRGKIENLNTRTGGIVGEIGTIYKEMTIEFKNLYNITNLETGIVGYINYNIYNSPTYKFYFENVYDCNDIHLTKNDVVTYEGEIFKKTEEEIRTQDFIDNTMNKYIKENNLESQGWRLWNLGEEGYPIIT